MSVDQFADGIHGFLLAPPGLNRGLDQISERILQRILTAYVPVRIIPGDKGF